MSSEKPTFDGDWSKASGQERAAHMARVKQWKADNPEAADAAAPTTRGGAGPVVPADELTSLPLDQIRHLAAHSRNDMTRLQAAKFLAEREEQQAHAEELAERDAVTEALKVLPQRERLMALEAMTVRPETGYRSIFCPDFIFNASTGDWVYSPDEEDAARIDAALNG